MRTPTVGQPKNTSYPGPQSTQDHLDAQSRDGIQGHIAALERTRQEQTELLDIANQQAQQSTASLLQVSTALEQFQLSRMTSLTLGVISCVNNRTALKLYRLN